MRAAACRIEGEHDFASFQAAGAARQSTIRLVSACEIIEQADPIGQLQQISRTRRLVAIEVEANGFLYNMVRNIVGSLVQVGRGKYPPSWIDEVMAAKNRDLAGPTAPPQGLFLLRVWYPNCED
jgi:tRNA pseudouridine38-40 synthase